MEELVKELNTLIWVMTVGFSVLSFWLGLIAGKMK